MTIIEARGTTQGILTPSEASGHRLVHCCFGIHDTARHGVPWTVCRVGAISLGFQGAVSLSFSKLGWFSNVFHEDPAIRWGGSRSCGLSRIDEFFKLEVKKVSG